MVVCASVASGFTAPAATIGAPRARASTVVASTVEDVGKYCADVLVPERRTTSKVQVGPVPIGSEVPIVLQTMGTTDTRDARLAASEKARARTDGRTDGLDVDPPFRVS